MQHSQHKMSRKTCTVFRTVDINFTTEQHLVTQDMLYLVCLEHGSKRELEWIRRDVCVYIFKALNGNWNVLDFAFLKVGQCYPRSVGSTTISGCTG